MTLSAGLISLHAIRNGLPSVVSTAKAEISREVAFDIPPQLLETALDTFGAATRTQVLYETALAKGHWSNGVKGVYSPDAALRLLLVGTGFDFDYTTERAITLVPSRTSNSAARPDADIRRHIARFDHFLGGVQAGIMTALCRDNEARPGDFKVEMRFWINPAGAITSPVLLTTTGRPSRDRAITSVLTRIAFSELPPAGLPQPITMVLTKGAMGDRGGCANSERD
jgi:hypothetical protein